MTDTISIVVPALNERQNLEELHRRLVCVFTDLPETWELVVVDDGSDDGTREWLAGAAQRDSRVRGIVLSRSFGQSAAITAGIEAALGDAVVIMDADLQDPPEVIPKLIACWRQGFHVAAGRRIRRPGERMSKRFFAWMFYRIMNAVVGWDIPFDTGEFRLIDRSVAAVYRACPQRHRLVRTLTSWSGFKQTTVEYEQGIRQSGTTKYSFQKSLRLGLTSLTSFSLAPVRLATAFGALCVVGSVLALAALALGYLLGWQVPGLVFLIVSLWFMGGVQCVFLGIVGEYAGRTYMETQHRPIFVVEETFGLSTARSETGASDDLESARHR
ncbi:MAG: dolichol-phosphate mannosyltransferase [Candidatus Hydrogenedentota bacterium]